MNWQPIETAPKDGTAIWLFEATDWPVCGVYRVISGEDFHWEGWLYADELLSEVKPDGLTPTHWMPLPEPPN